MAVHAVQVDVPMVEILNKDMVIRVLADEGTFSRLTISRGGLGWYSYKDQLERHFTWEQFERLVQSKFDV